MLKVKRIASTLLIVSFFMCNTIFPMGKPSNKNIQRTDKSYWIKSTLIMLPVIGMWLAYSAYGEKSKKFAPIAMTAAATVSIGATYCVQSNYNEKLCSKVQKDKEDYEQLKLAVEDYHLKTNFVVRGKLEQAGIYCDTYRIIE